MNATAIQTLIECARKSAEIRNYCRQIEVYKRMPVWPFVAGVIFSFLGSFSLKIFASASLFLWGLCFSIGIGSVLFLLERFLGIILAQKEIEKISRSEK